MYLINASESAHVSMARTKTASSHILYSKIIISLNSNHSFNRSFRILYFNFNLIQDRRVKSVHIQYNAKIHKLYSVILFFIHITNYEDRVRREENKNGIKINYEISMKDISTKVRYD